MFIMEGSLFANQNIKKQSVSLRPANRLIKEKSPYLLQHAFNPVLWFPWGDEAFQKAKAENKPIFLSIGYSTCHWCHVMERESFENPEIASILNDNFVSIKVDREERPDIDGVYMSVVMAITGSGGWPMSVFLTPEKKPFYGGTYFPPEPRWGAPGFKNVLMTIGDAWKNRHDEILRSSESLLGIFNEQQKDATQDSLTLNKQTLKIALNQLKESFDEVHGGFGTQPKFPMGHNLSFLLRAAENENDSGILGIVEKTLTAIASGGIYDHIGGGFHRYATDQKWHVPHFEKMLYDQAILSKTYLEAYQATRNNEYAQVAREIFDYVLREMQDKGGGFYSAQDADSIPADADKKDHPEKKEGAFFVWSQKEIGEILGKWDAEIFNYSYGVDPDGNVEADPHGELTGKNILYQKHSLTETAGHFKKKEAETQAVLNRSQEKIFQARLKRPKPHLDDKVLTDWNGLMISSLAFGSRVLNDPKYAMAAEKAAKFLLQKLVDENQRLLHRYRDGESAILGTLEDYAFFIHGLIDLYEATLKPEYLKEAKHLTDEMIRLFWDDKSGGFFFTAFDAEELLYRRKDIYDGAAPSGNSIAALDLIRLGRIMPGDDGDKKAQRLFRTFYHDVSQRPSAHTQLLIALDYALNPSYEIVIAAKKDDPVKEKMIQKVFEFFIPRKVVIWRPAEERQAAEIFSLCPFLKEQPSVGGRATMYVCENHVCQLPLTDVTKIDQVFKKHH